MKYSLSNNAEASNTNVISVVMVKDKDNFIQNRYHHAVDDKFTHPVESAYCLWLTAVVCEMWFDVFMGIGISPLNGLLSTEKLTLMVIRLCAR
ncbi:hypothetical protein Bca4012_066194 [Brassica carinata]|uniref:Uncharacterized protein n=1 Tax=Brassica carinata TaxID=52824 RepID=A0A8X7VR08_BRACI|nr:hypothetical protein Bca52824_018497 [Brassica carinata]